MKKTVFNGIMIFALTALIAIAVVLFAATAEDVAFAEGLSFEDGYVKSVEKNYNGKAETITVKAATDESAEYVWYRREEGGEVRVADGDTLSVKYPYDSGAYFCVATTSGASAQTDDVTINIYKAEITVAIDDKSVLYGDGEAVLSYTKKSSLYGDDTEEELGISLFRQEGNSVGKYVIGGTSESRLYAVNFINGVYEIKKRKIVVDVASLDSVYGERTEELLYGVRSGYEFAPGEDEADLGIVLKKEPGTDAGRYAVTGSYDNDNYEVIFTPATYTIKPKPTSARLAGVNDLVYNGKVPDIKCEIIGEAASMGVTAIVSFDKAVKNAGDYVAYARISNKNYEFDNGGVFPFSIKKAPLIIKLADIAYANPAVTPVFRYSGFAEGEDENSLTEKPRVDFPVSAGEYEVTPYGAQGDNYEITYAAGKVTVYKSQIQAECAVLTGAFLPDGNLVVTKVSGVENFDKLYRKTAVAYEINAGGSVAGEYSGKIECEKLFPLFLRACIVDGKGERHKLNGFTVNNGYAEFVADAEGTLVIYYDFILPAIIISLVAVIAIAVAIKVGRDRKKYKTALAVQTAAVELADEARRETRDRNR
ncbi:MAG: MBG domain-containing protein [Christensenellales bacterium]